VMLSFAVGPFCSNNSKLGESTGVLGNGVVRTERNFNIAVAPSYTKVGLTEKCIYTYTKSKCILND